MESQLYRILQEMRDGAGSIHGQERDIQAEHISPLERYRDNIIQKYHGENPESDWLLIYK